jgi:OTT_1508-like deaminase
LDVLNIRCSHIPSDDVAPIEEWKFVTSAFPNAALGHPENGKKRVKFTQHCEITLALAMLKRLRLCDVKVKKVEIGVSKACCGWCCEYLGLLHQEDPRKPILVRATHGKLPDGWMMPPSGSPLITKKMAALIEEKIDDVVWEIHSSRRSDSNELEDFEGTEKLGLDIVENLYEYFNRH